MRPKSILAALLLTITGLQTAWAQKLTLRFTDNSVLEYNFSSLESIEFSEEDIVEHEWVDLGLPSGTLWATCNVGANSPEEYGDYFAWGETSPKNEYNWITYFDSEDNGDTFKKYYNKGGQTELLPEDDAATTNWGSDWQMPSIDQLNELLNSNYTTMEWTTQNGVKGRLITSNSNGKSIFLPAAGYRYDTSLDYADSFGGYWSRSLSEITGNRYAFSLTFYLLSLSTNSNFFRSYGFSVRPVRKQEPKEHEYVDLDLPSGTLWATCNVGANSPEEYGDYFAWGETEPKSKYNWSTYFDSEDNGETFKNYYNGGQTELLPDNDAATINWGSEWQMPSQEQLKELFNEIYTTSVNTTLNNVEGVLVTSLTNGKSIFLPKAGRRNGEDYIADGGSYWSRNLYESDSYDVWAIHCWINNTAIHGPFDRSNGLSVRPVRKQEPKEHEYVDLDLPSGTLWATCNVGANSPEEYGDYFAWGETTAKSDYVFSNYFDSEYEKYHKGGQTELLPEDDAATANWGSEWQMPSLEQCEELINSSHTTTEWTTQNGINGYKITSKSNGESIFLPATGYRYDTSLIIAGSDGYYWSCSLGTSGSDGAYCLYFRSVGIYADNYYARCAGRSVRPVRVKEKKEYEHVDLGLPEGIYVIKNGNTSHKITKK